MNVNVLIVVAHPDDETLGCGASIYRHVQNGDRVSVLVLSNGVGSRQQDSDTLNEIVNHRICSANEACDILGVNDLVVKDYPDNSFDQCALLDIVRDIEAEVSRLRPEVVYTHSHTDLNVDHQIVNRAVMTAIRPYPGQTVRKIMEFEVLSSTGWYLSSPHFSFAPNYFVDVSEYIEHKLNAFSCYKSEIQVYPFARSFESIKALAMYRGSMVGVHYAEAFNLQRALI